MTNSYRINGTEAIIEVLYRGAKMETVIDLPDLSVVQQHAGTWAANLRRNTFYAMAVTSKRVGRRVILMHREILSARPGMVVDHINHNGLDNRRSNLREVTRGDNSFNLKGARRTSRSGVRGVSWDNDRRKWVATCKRQGQQFWIGRFDSIPEADEAARRMRAKVLAAAA